MIIFMERISADHLFRHISTINDTQHRLESRIRHIFQRTGSTAIIRSILLVCGMIRSSCEALKLIVYTLCYRRATVRATNNQLRNYLHKIVLKCLQLNPEALLINGLGEIAYQVSIVVNIDQPNDSGRLMISQIREMGLFISETLHMVILDARSGESLISGQQSI
ncbi:unnamed protein product [Rotaria socialis]|uniref:Uncharacterized protein n=1 Tax=Rotaria socialis TaxID=392032 RepID=A0A817UDY3_9BILA|nr:unnamed protein product [Rotaria socialis]